MFICLQQGANDLHMIQLMPVPPIISCSSKIQNGLPFWCRLTQVVLEKRPLNRCSSSSSSSSFIMPFCITLNVCNVLVAGTHRYHDQVWIYGKESIFCIAQT